MAQSSKIVQHMEGLHGRQNDFMAFSSLSSVVEKATPLVWVGPQASIAATCELMRAHRFISLPVYDEEKRSILGMADILDICSYLCWGTMHFFERTSDASADASDLEMRSKMNEVAIVEVLKQQQQRGRSSLVVKRHLDSVCSLLDQMAQGLHRALVRVWPEDEDEEGQRLEHYRLVAQIDLVRFLVEHRRNLNHHLINSSVAALALAGPEPASAATSATQPGQSSTGKSAVKSFIYSIEEGKTALEAFRTLAVSGVHAIGIVGSGSLGGADGGDGQRLLYNLSASDLRGITPDTVHLLREPVEVFLTRVQESDPTRPKNLVTCSPGTTLIEVMELVLRSRVHRVWVIDPKNQRPVGLITLTDILSKFASFDYARAYAAGTKNIVPLSLSSPH